MIRPAGSVLAGALLVAGCTESREVVGYRRPAPPTPRATQAPPPNARADAVVVNVQAAPLDTNGNGYADLIQATAYLFDMRYAPAMRENGTFVFLLYAAGESAAQPAALPLRQWRYGDGGLAITRGRTYFGPCYVFRLSLLDEGPDALGVAMADLVCRFEPADGRDPARARGVTSIPLGRRGAAPAAPPPAPAG